MMWAIDELKKLSEVQPDIVERILEEVRVREPELYKSMVIGAYVDEKISLSKAAELLNVTRNELQKELKEKGIPIRTLSKEDVIAEADAIRTW